MAEQKYAVINGDSDIDYMRVFGPFDSYEEAAAAIVGYPDGEEYGENLVRVVPLLAPEELQREIEG